MNTCPCCGQTTTADFTPDNLTDLQRAIYERLAKDAGKWVPTDNLTHAAWGLDPNGGPTNTQVALTQAIRRINRRIAPLTIVSKQWHGYSLRITA